MTTPIIPQQSTGVFALEIQPGQSSRVFRQLGGAMLEEQHFLPQVSRLLRREVGVILAPASTSSAAMRVPGVSNVEGSAEHIFYAAVQPMRPLFPPPVEATTPGIEGISDQELGEVLYPIPVRDTAREMPLGAPGLFLGPPVERPSLGSWQEILDSLEAEAAWEMSQGEGSIIAVIDTGVDGSRISPGQKLWGWADHPELDPWQDGVGHGTMVAMIAAGRGQEGFMGVAPMAQLVSLRLRANEKGALPTASLLRALDQALWLRRESGRRVILNNSWGLYGCKSLLLPCSILVTRVIAAADRVGAFLSVWAAGNNRHICAQPVPNYCMNSLPADVSVAAVTRQLWPQFYSSAGGQCYSLSPTCAAPTYGVLPWVAVKVRPHAGEARQ